MTTMILGHAPKVVMQAVEDQLTKGLAYNAPNEHQVRLAKILCQRIPSFDLLRFTNSGTEATLNTLRAARAFTGKSRFAKAEGGYHGTHDSVTVSLRINPDLAGDADRPNALPSSAGLPDGVVEQVLVIPFNDTQASLKLLEENKDELAAVIVEPVAGNMGMIPPAKGFLEGLRSLTSDRGALLILDEVMTGFRVGPSGAQGLYGIAPDLTTFGKVIGGGFPVGAFGGQAEIMDQMAPAGPVYQAGTLSGNPIAMRAGLATLEYLVDPSVYQGLESMSYAFTEALASEAERAGIALQTSVVGGMFGFYFAEDSIDNFRHQPISLSP